MLYNVLYKYCIMYYIIYCIVYYNIMYNVLYNILSVNCMIYTKFDLLKTSINRRRNCAICFAVATSRRTLSLCAQSRYISPKEAQQLQSHQQRQEIGEETDSWWNFSSSEEEQQQQVKQG